MKYITGLRWLGDTMSIVNQQPALDIFCIEKFRDVKLIHEIHENLLHKNIHVHGILSHTYLGDLVNALRSVIILRETRCM